MFLNFANCEMHKSVRRIAGYFFKNTTEDIDINIEIYNIIAGYIAGV